MFSTAPQDKHQHAGRTEVDSIVRLKEFLYITGLGRSTVYKLINDGVIERPLQISVRAVGWRISYVNSFLKSRPVSGVR